ncbi:MAG: Ig-like domain-containing protein, partial [Bacteroidota bacterium]
MTSTDTNGISSANGVANTIAGTYDVTASAVGVSSPGIFFGIRNVPATPANITAMVGTTPQSAQVLTRFSVNLAALVKDAFNNPIPNKIVTFTPPGSGPSGTFEGGMNTATTNTIGVATARPFTANNTPGGPYNVSASVTGVSPAPIFQLTNLIGPPGNITILAGSPQTTQVGTAFPIRFRVLVKDVANNPIPNVTVRWSGGAGSFEGGVDTAVTDNDGIAEANRFIADALAGSHRVIALTPGAAAPVEFQLTNLAGSAISIGTAAGSPQSAQVSQAFPTLFEATVRDTFDNRVFGAQVTFTAPATGPSGTFFGGGITYQTTSDSSGIARAVVFSANINAGRYLVAATTPGVSLPANYDLTNTPGPAGSIAVRQGSQQSARINTRFGIDLWVIVRDGANNPKGGVPVRFSALLTGASGRFPGGRTDTTVVTDAGFNLGIAIAPPFSANSIAGSHQVTATALNVSQAAQFDLTNLPGTVASIQATAGTPQSAQVNTAFANPFKATVRDSAENPVPGMVVTFTTPFSGASGTFDNGNTAQTDQNGVATANTFLANSFAGSYVVRASVRELTSAANYDLTNTTGPVASINVTTGTPQTTVVNTRFDSVLSVRVIDGSGNPVSNVNVTFTAASSGASGTFVSNGATTKIVQTNALGIASADTFKANSIAGSYSVTASAAGITGQAIFALTNAVGPLNKFLVEAENGGAIPSQQAVVPFNIKISAQDLYNNLTPSFFGRVRISSTGSFLGDTITAPFDNGVLTHRIIIRRAGSGITIKATGTADSTKFGTSNSFQVNNPIPNPTSVTPAIGNLLETLTL